MSWLQPGAAWWLLLLPALLALYLFRPRPEKKTVSSLRLWRALPQVDKPKARLRRPPLSLLMLLQLLLLLAGAVALMQPVLAGPAGRHIVIVVDASGSMRASAGASTRFEQAKAEARRVTGSIRGQDRVTLLRVASKVTTECSACTGMDAGSAIDRLSVGAGRADMGAAVELARGLEQRAGGAGGAETIVISDGSFAALSKEDIPESVRFVAVGGNADNLGITALSARLPPDGSPGYQAYARVDNFGSSEADVEVAAFADTVPLPVKRVTLPAGGHGRFTWQVPVGTGSLHVSLSGNDALAEDNRASIVLAPAKQQKVYIASGKPELYQRALAGVPGLEVVAWDSTKGGDGYKDAAFTIIEGKAPDVLPGGSLLLVNPSGGGLPVGEDMGQVSGIEAGGDHPLLAGLDLQALNVQSAKKIGEVSWLEPVVTSVNGPLLLAGEQEGRRVAALMFDPRQSNLPKLAAFPLLMSNLVDWLYPLAGLQALRPGESVHLAPGTRVQTPGGREVVVNEGGEFTETEEPGVYRVVGDEGGGSKEAAGVTFVVNMTDATESDLAVRAHPELEHKGKAETAVRVANQDYWPPLAGLVCLLVVGEWLFYCGCISTQWLPWKRGRA